MSTKLEDKYDIGVWYQSTDFKELYKIVKGGPGDYDITTFYDDKHQYYGTLGQCREWMLDHAMDHDTYQRAAMKRSMISDGK